MRGWSSHASSARRFSPRANGIQVDDSEQIDLLISTDVLSEGVNLQDADTLINYNLHWNPVRLILRAGRIDRIGSTNEEIYIASFLPERELEENLGLEEVLKRRIDDFIRVFGEDSSILPGEEKLDERTMADAYSGEALERADDSDEDLML
jgi:superfamily II DNA/RNA helicase